MSKLLVSKCDISKYITPQNKWIEHGCSFIYIIGASNINKCITWINADVVSVPMRQLSIQVTFYKDKPLSTRSLQMAHTEQQAIKGLKPITSVKPLKCENQRSNLYKKRETPMNHTSKRQLLNISFLTV